MGAHLFHVHTRTYTSTHLKRAFSFSIMKQKPLNLSMLLYMRGCFINEYEHTNTHTDSRWGRMRMVKK